MVTVTVTVTYLIPAFFAELVLLTKAILFLPFLADFDFGLGEVQGRWKRRHCDRLRLFVTSLVRLVDG